jgi:hypothetical protein
MVTLAAYRFHLEQQRLGKAVSYPFLSVLETLATVVM